MHIAYPLEMVSMLPGPKQPSASLHYDHQIRFASKCGHNIHPSSAEHTPWCTSCAVSQARAKSDVALKKLVAKGGLNPPEYMRNQRWNRARKGYLIAKKRLDRARTDEQLRWEREQAWNTAHERASSQLAQAAAAVLPETCSLCPACDSMVASYPTNIPEAQVAAHVAWWERPGALATPTDIFGRTRTPAPRHSQSGWYARTTKGNAELRQIVRNHRHSKRQEEMMKQAWYARNTTERAIRCKYNLGSESEIQSAFWDSPLSLLLSRQTYQYARDQARMEERYARGNKSRPKPPPSPLSSSQSVEDLHVDQDFAETLYETEEKERLERQAKKVAKEVGYLYFVGGSIDGMMEWKEDIDQGSKVLVTGTRERNYESSSSEEDIDDVDDDIEMREDQLGWHVFRQSLA